MKLLESVTCVSLLKVENGTFYRGGVKSKEVEGGLLQQTCEGATDVLCCVVNIKLNGMVLCKTF